MFLKQVRAMPAPQDRI